MLLTGACSATFAQQGQSLLEPLPGPDQTTQPAQQTVQPAQQTVAPVAADSGQPQQLSQLFYQLQVLQQEVQELRGLIEEQSYQLNRLARDQQEQYIDLDGRIASMTTGGASTGRSPATSNTASGSGAMTGGSTSISSSGGVTGLPPAGGTSESERDSYTRAFDLMKARQFDESAQAFNQLILTYPNGQYTPNAYYWLGELYLAQSDSEQARASFAQVLNLYPDHPKVPDSLYKMGVVYHRLGENARAIDYFQRVIREYPNSSAAGLATRYMAELQ